MKPLFKMRGKFKTGNIDDLDDLITFNANQPIKRNKSKTQRVKQVHFINNKKLTDGNDKNTVIIGYNIRDAREREKTKKIKMKKLK